MFPIVLAAALTAPTPARVERLGHPDFAVRETTQLLTLLSLAAAPAYHPDPALAAGRAHADPEVARRSRETLDRDYGRRRKVVEDLLDKAVPYYPYIDSFFYQPERGVVLNHNDLAGQVWPYARGHAPALVAYHALADFRTAVGATNPGPAYGKRYPGHRYQARELGIVLCLEDGYTVAEVVALYAAVYPTDMAQVDRMGLRDEVPPAVFAAYHRPRPVVSCKGYDPATGLYDTGAMVEYLAAENFISPWFGLR